MSAGDTDSFFIHLKGISAADLLQRLNDDDMLDSSNYPRTHPLYSTKNKARLGCFKDESGGRPFRAWYFLRPKCYELVHCDTSSVRKAKGVGKLTGIAPDTFEQLVKSSGSGVFTDETRIQSQCHNVATVKFHKLIFNNL